MKRPSTGASIGYTLFAMATVWWQGCWTVLFNTKDPSWAASLVKIGYSGIIFLPTTFYHFTMEYVEPNTHRWSIRWHYLISFGFLLTLWISPYFVRGFYTHTWGFYPKVGFVHVVYLIHLTFLAVVSLYLPYRKLKEPSILPLRISQLRLVLVANLVYCGGAVDFLVNYGAAFYPFGFVFVLVSSGIVVYAIVRFALLDLNLAARGGIIAVLTATFLSAPLGVLIHFTDSRLVTYVGTFTAFLIGPRLYERLSSFLASAVDHLPAFRGRYNDFERLNLHFQVITLAKNVPDWARAILSVSRHLYRPERAMVLLRDGNRDRLMVKASFGVNNAAKVFSILPLGGGLASHLAAGQRVFFTDLHMNDITNGAREEAEKAIRFLQGVVFVPFMFEGVLYGVLALGKKAEGRIYNTLDLASLEGLARAAEHCLRVVLSGLSQEQRSAVWAHDLVKPFTLKGSFLLLEEMLKGSFGAVTDGMRNAIQLMMGDVDFVRENLTHLLHPGQPDNYAIQSGPLAPVMERLRDKYGALAMMDGIEWRVEMPVSEIRVFWDSAMIEYRVLGNLLENAFRHTPRGGSVELGCRITKDMLLFCVKDSGIGIREEDIGNLFQPRMQMEGKDRGLAGLGLYSAKTVVEAHKGRIWVESTYGKGSCFYFELPLASVGINGVKNA